MDHFDLNNIFQLIKRFIHSTHSIATYQYLETWAASISAEQETSVLKQSLLFCETFPIIEKYIFLSRINSFLYAENTPPKARPNQKITLHKVNQIQKINSLFETSYQYNLIIGLEPQLEKAHSCIQQIINKDSAHFDETYKHLKNEVHQKTQRLMAANGLYPEIS